MCNARQGDWHRDSIELTITIDGKMYTFHRELPAIVKASDGPMSMHAAIEPITTKLMCEAVYNLLKEAAIVLDRELPHPRRAWWCLDEAIGKKDGST
jgi:hypothetical protein